jgi:selenide,water dikinase
MGVELIYDRLPFYPNARQMYQKGETTGSNKPNRQLVAGHWEAKRSLSSDGEELLFDPQTSGGLLLSVPEPAAEALVAALREAGVAAAACVGTVAAAERPVVRVV